MARILGWVRDGWLIVGICLLLFVIADAVLNVVIDGPEPQLVVPGSVAPSPYSAPFLENSPWVSDFLAEFRDSRRLRWEPYSYWRREPFDGSLINIDESGVRATPTSSVNADDPLILMLGGSAMWGTGARDEHTIPSRLAQALADAGRSARVVNLGERAYVSGQSLAALQQWIREGSERPELAVFYDGVNDVFSALQSGRPGIPQNESQRTSDFGASRTVRRLVPAIAAHFQGLTKLRAKLAPAAEREPASGSDVAATYLTTTDMGRAVARASGFDALFFWQPSIFGKARLSEFEESVVSASLSAHRDTQLSADAQIARQSAPQVQALMYLFDRNEETVFMDYAHVSEAANEAIAQAMLPYVLSALPDATAE